MAPDPDVLIVGAGPSGAVAAKRLAEEGFRVTVLEQGDWADYSNFPLPREGRTLGRRPRPEVRRYQAAATTPGGRFVVHRLTRHDRRWR